MKKAIMLKFLFYAILGLLFFVPTVLWASQFFKLSDKAKESFNNLAGAIISVSDGEIVSSVLYLDDKSIVAGFAKDSNRFEQHGYYYNNPNPDQIYFTFNRPKECQNQKACICLCKKSYLGLQESFPESTKCQEPICKSFDGIDFLSEKITEKYEDGRPKSALKGGFLYFRSANSPLPHVSTSTRVLYIQKYKNFVDVCSSSPCIDDKLKEMLVRNKEGDIELT